MKQPLKITRIVTKILTYRQIELQGSLILKIKSAIKNLPIIFRAPIQLVDEKGCVVRDKIMSPFKKIKNFDATANVLAYAYFQV